MSEEPELSGLEIQICRFNDGLDGYDGLLKRMKQGLQPPCFGMHHAVNFVSGRASTSTFVY